MGPPVASAVHVDQVSPQRSCKLLMYVRVKSESLTTLVSRSCLLGKATMCGLWTPVKQLQESNMQWMYCKIEYAVPHTFRVDCHVKHVEQQKDIPSKLLQVRGVASLLFETSSLASSILESASTHQRNASDFRLGHPKTDMRSTSSSTSGKFENLSKAAKVAGERKAKRLETKTKDDGGIKIAATIWMLDGKKCNQVCIYFHPWNS